MKHTHAQRLSIIAWRRKLHALANAVDTGDVNRDLRELYALDIAQIESGIYGLLAAIKEAAAVQIVEDTLRDILASCGDPDCGRKLARQCPKNRAIR
jgi:hypothetical protein